MHHDPSQEAFPALYRRLASLDAEAFAEIWRRLRGELLAIARRCIRRTSGLAGYYDEEDAVSSVKTVMWEGLLKGKLVPPRGTDELMPLARTLIARRVMARAREQRAAKRHPKPGTGTGRDLHFEGRYVPDDMDLFACDLPSADVATEAKDQIEWLLNLLDEERRAVAQLRLEQKTVAEIAKLRGKSRRTIERMSREILALWKDALRDG